MNIVKKQNELASDIGETTEVSWSPPKNLTWDQWESIGNTLQVVNGAVNWWIGDWLNVGEQKWGETYTQAIDVTDSSIETLKKRKAVSERVAKEIRSPKLSWTHHFYVAYLPEGERGPLLAMAEELELSSRELKSVCDLWPQDRARVVQNFTDNPPGSWLSLADILENSVTIGISAQEPIPGTTYSEDAVTKEKQRTTGEYSAQNEDSGTDEEIPFSDPLEWMEGDENTENTVIEFLESHGLFVVYSDRNEMEFENGIAVMAQLDEEGSPILLWRVP